jgi:hypothetical protein
MTALGYRNAADSMVVDVVAIAKFVMLNNLTGSRPRFTTYL